MKSPKKDQQEAGDDCQYYDAPQDVASLLNHISVTGQGEEQINLIGKASIYFLPQKKAVMEILPLNWKNTVMCDFHLTIDSRPDVESVTSWKDVSIKAKS